MWKLTIEDDQANKTVVHLVRDEYSVGRAEDNTVRLTERNISRRHARLARRNERWVMIDNKSYNGCYINGQRLGEPQELSHGDLIQVGDYRLEVHDETLMEAAAQAAAVPATGARASALLGQPDRLVMLVGPTVGSEYPLGATTIVVGRGEECDIAVNHPSVSRVHAEIHALGDGRYEIVDRESVNGVELPKTLLDARDVVELGDVILKFIPAGEVYVPGAEESQQVSAFYAAGTAAPVIPAAASHGMSMGVKVAIAAGIVAVVGVLAIMIATRSPAPVAIEATQDQTDVSAQLLAEAKALLAKGDAEAAFAKSSEIPEASDLRRSADFRAIQAGWADALFAKASATSDTNEKRTALDQIARATSVDSARRERAASEIAALNSGTVDVSELPSAAPPVAAVPSTPPVAGGQAIAQAEPKAPAPAAAGKPAVQATLVRKNPFDDGPGSEPPASGNAQDLATSGERTKLVQAKSMLQAKAQSGQATDRELKMLRALCKQLGDASCSN
jgi:pSer/pThr/pTyr-binding forkhead associated (FHA) protein